MAKISDKDFWKLLRKHAGLFGRTARAIKQEFGENYSRQAVRVRALKDPDQLEDIRQENHDYAEEGLQDLMHDVDKRIRIRALELYLKGPGRERGFEDKTKIDLPPEIVINIKRKVAKRKKDNI